MIFLLDEVCNPCQGSHDGIDGERRPSPRTKVTEVFPRSSGMIRPWLSGNLRRKTSKTRKILSISLPEWEKEALQGTISMSG